MPAWLWISCGVWATPPPGVVLPEPVAQPQAAPAPPEASPAPGASGAYVTPVLASIAPAQDRFRLGQPLWIVATFEGQAPQRGGGRPIFRDGHFEIQVLDAEGTLAPDPKHRFPVDVPMADHAGAPQASLALDLAAYAWLTPGRWQVWVRWLPTGRPRDGAAWHHTEIEIVSVSEVEVPQIVAGVVPQFVDQAHDRRHGYDALGHEIFVPHLEALVASAAPGVDERALYGLDACPCVAATEALIRLHDGASGDLLRRRIREVLGWRVPQGWWHSRQAWRAELGEPVRRMAREVLSATGPGWERELPWASRVLARIGEPQDTAALLEAVGWVLEAPMARNADVRRLRALEALAFAMRRAPPDPGGLSPDVAALVGLIGWDGRTGTPPPDQEARVLRALESRHPAVQAFALWRLPPHASEALVIAAIPLVGTSSATDRPLHGWTQGNAGPRIRDALLAELERAEPTEIPPERIWPGRAPDRATSVLKLLREQLPLDDWIERVVAQLGRAPSVALIRMLIEGIDRSVCVSQGISIDPSEAPALIAAWERALSERRPELRAHPLPLEGADPALLPGGYSCTLRMGERWP